MNYFKEILQERLGEVIKSINSITGGDINDVYKIITNQNTYVLKVNRKDIFPKMFEKEKLGLEILTKSGVKSPNVILTFSDAEYQYLVLEFIEEESINPVFWKNFAEDLTKIHRTTANSFGLDHHNYIGSLHQNNSKKETWETFFIENRIKPLVKIAFDKNRLDRNHLKPFENLYTRLDKILPKENPSLVHGDLWGGNLMKGKNNTPVFIDPAVYFGHREMDIAMTQMFGGFDNSYLDHYNEIFPLEKGWKDRIEIHNLYPNLVHLILFGRSYLGGIERVIGLF
ncbi:MAG: fructosamine kinase family protein [Flavobacteriaceae bacterium]|nr:fructosamine kinase family protein [Flavobacteriaceae bacterium]